MSLAVINIRLIVAVFTVCKVHIFESVYSFSVTYSLEGVAGFMNLVLLYQSNIVAVQNDTAGNIY